MRIRIRTNWFGRLYVYVENDTEHLYYGQSIYLIGKGNHLKLYNKNKEQVLYIKEGHIGTFKNVNKTSYIIELLKSKVTIELKCVDYQNGQWTFDKGDDRFTLNFKPGQTNTLFKNDLEIANYTKENGESIIKADDNQNALLLTSLHLVFGISND